MKAPANEAIVAVGRARTARFKRYPTYKNSGVEWLGEIPAHWNLFPLFTLARERVVRNAGGGETNVLSLSYGRIIRRDVTDNFGLMPESFDTYQIVEPGNIVLRLTDLQNDKRSLRVGLVGERGIITSAYVALSIRPHLVPAYAASLLHAYDVTKVFYSFGGGVRQTMKFEDLKWMPVLVPSEPEQRAIAAFLERETLRIDALVMKKERLIDLLQEKRIALITRAVTKGLDPNVPLKGSGVEWLGEIPAHWNLFPLFTLARERVVRNAGGGETNVLSLSYGRIIRRDVTDNFGLMPESFDTYQIVEPGNIVLRLTDLQNDKRSLRVGLVGERGIITSAYVALSIRPHLVPAYAASLLHAYDVTKVFYSFGGGVRQTMKFEDLKWMPVLVPSEPEQRAIAAFLERETLRIDALVARIRDAIDLLKELRTALISAAVTGKLDVREVVA